MNPLRYIAVLLCLSVATIGWAEPNVPGPSISVTGTDSATQIVERPTAPVVSDLPTTASGEPRAAKPDSADEIVAFILSAPVLLSVAGCLLITGIGAKMGADGKLVIYSGPFDAILTAAFLIVVCMQDDMARIIAGILLLVSGAISYRANHSLLKLLLIIPTKMGLLLLLALLGIFALGSFWQLAQGKPNEGKDKASIAVIGVAGAAGFHFLAQFIQRLTATPPSRETGTAAPAQTHQENLL